MLQGFALLCKSQIISHSQKTTWHHYTSNAKLHNLGSHIPRIIEVASWRLWFFSRTEFCAGRKYTSALQKKEFMVVNKKRRKLACWNNQRRSKKAAFKVLFHQWPNAHYRTDARQVTPCRTGHGTAWVLLVFCSLWTARLSFEGNLTFLGSMEPDELRLGVFHTFRAWFYLNTEPMQKKFHKSRTEEHFRPRQPDYFTEEKLHKRKIYFNHPKFDLSSSNWQMYPC